MQDGAETQRAHKVRPWRVWESKPGEQKEEGIRRKWGIRGRAAKRGSQRKEGGAGRLRGAGGRGADPAPGKCHTHSEAGPLHGRPSGGSALHEGPPPWALAGCFRCLPCPLRGLSSPATTNKCEPAHHAPRTMSPGSQSAAVDHRDLV